MTARDENPYRSPSKAERRTHKPRPFLRWPTSALALRVNHEITKTRKDESFVPARPREEDAIRRSDFPIFSCFLPFVLS